MARFDNSLKQTFKNSVAIAVTNPKTTLPLIGIQILFCVLCYALSQAKIFMLLLGFAFIAYCNSLILTRLFASFEESV